MKQTTQNPNDNPLLRPARPVALREAGLLDGPAEPAFDRLTRRAARLLSAPVSLVSLVDAHRQGFKSAVGLSERRTSGRETPLSHFFCRYVVTTGAPVVVSDARTEEWVRRSGLAPELGVIAYLGVPLRTPAGHVLGSFCVIDSRPREWGPDDVELMRELAALLLTEIELREEVRRREHSEASLRECRLILNAVTEGTTDAVFVKDRDGRYLMINAAGARFLGKPVAEVLGRHDSEFLTPDTVQQVLTTDGVVLSTGETVTREEQITAAGVTRTYLATKGPFRDEEGQVAGVIGISRDISDRKDSRAVPLRSDGRTLAFQSLGQRLNEARTPEQAARVVLELADELLGWDACWLELADTSDGSTRTVILMDEVEGRRAEVAAPCSDLTASPLALQAVDEGPVLVLREPESMPELDSGEHLPFGDTSRLSASIMCVSIRTGGRVVGALSIQSYSFHAYSKEDLNVLQALADYCAGALERTQAESAREQLQQQLVQSQKLEAVGRLAGGIAHDFNNMLAVINGYSDLLLPMTEPRSPVRQGLREIHRAGERAADLTRQLLAFSRKQMLEPKVLDLNEIVFATESMLRRLIGEDIELSVRLAPALGMVKADPSQVDQIVLNLAVNARDAMPRGGKLTLETRNVELDAAHVRQYPDVAPGPYVLFSVTDTGIGMDPEVLSRVWEPFFTTKRVGEGTGLGLATVYGIVKQSGGHAEIESTPGEGTIFRIYLPRLEGVAAGSTPALGGRLPAGSETVLVVEDEEMVRGLVLNVLLSSGYTVLEARDAEEAAARARQHPGPIHLLLADVMMPGGEGGRTVAECVSGLCPGIKVLYMSGYADDAIVRHGVELGGTPFIQKPFTPSALAHKVRDVLQPDGGLAV